MARGEDVRVRVDVPAEIALVDVDPLRIRQVLGNLVANALRYAPKGSEVAIAGERAGSAGRPAASRDEGRTPDETIRLSVIDAGPGISPEVLPHLFDRFAKSAESRGSGLGLAIARRLVEAHGGTIWVEQPAGGGTAIRFELPAREGP
jgi:signal transduction histidine kinase